MAFTPSFTELSPDMKAMLLRNDPQNSTGLLSPQDMAAGQQQAAIFANPQQATGGLSISGIPGLAGSAPQQTAPAAAAPVSTKSPQAGAGGGSKSIGTVGSGYTVPATFNIQGF